MLVIHLMHSSPVKLGFGKHFHIREWRFQALKALHARPRSSWYETCSL